MLAKLAPSVPEIIGPSLAAQILKLDRSTIRRLVNRGAIPVHSWTPGGHARFRKSDIEQLRERLAERPKLPQSVKRLRQLGQAGARLGR